MHLGFPPLPSRHLLLLLLPRGRGVNRKTRVTKYVEEMVHAGVDRILRFLAPYHIHIHAWHIYAIGSGHQYLSVVEY